MTKKKKNVSNQSEINKANLPVQKQKRRIVAVALVACLLAGAGYIVWFRTKGATQEVETVKIVKTASQQVVYAQISEINGNEITYKIAEKMAQQETANSEDDDQQTNTQQTQQGQRGEQAGRGERPSGFGGGEGMPDMSGMFGGFGGGRGDSQNQNSQDEANTGMFVYDGATYLVGSEAVTTYIPVGTDVTTKLGTVTIFSRLAAKDCVAFVIEKVGEEEIIVAVYIVA